MFTHIFCVLFSKENLNNTISCKIYNIWMRSFSSAEVISEDLTFSPDAVINKNVINEKKNIYKDIIINTEYLHKVLFNCVENSGYNKELLQKE